jgi:hypothetical protein
MRKAFFVLFIFILSFNLFGQTASKTADNQSPVKFYQGFDYKPYLFEPYRAEYVLRGNLVGMNFDLFDFSTNIVELENEWQETQRWHLGFPEDEPQDIVVTSYIDLETGLLKKMTASLGGISSEYVFGSGTIDATATKGSKTKQISFANPTQIYPCAYSSAFLSYLPLDENFAASFVCFMPDEDDNGKPKISFQKRTLRVVGTERITVDGGTFDCFKLADETEEIKFNADGSIKAKKKRENQVFDEEKFWKNFYNATWIDKRTRQFVKGELKFKYGSVAVELQKSRRTNL